MLNDISCLISVASEDQFKTNQSRDGHVMNDLGSFLWAKGIYSLHYTITVVQQTTDHWHQARGKCKETCKSYLWCTPLFISLFFKEFETKVDKKKFLLKPS